MKKIIVVTLAIAISSFMLANLSMAQAGTPLITPTSPPDDRTYQSPTPAPTRTYAPRPPTSTPEPYPIDTVEAYPGSVSSIDLVSFSAVPVTTVMLWSLLIFVVVVLVILFIDRKTKK